MRPLLMSLRLAGLVSVAMLATATAAFAQAASPSLGEAKKDPILRAMLEELESFEADASYGALTRERVDHRRIVRVTVRVGDYKTDSSALRGDRGDGSLQIAAVEDDPVALRSALW